jgi:hypothetical protein
LLSNQSTGHITKYLLGCYVSWNGCIKPENSKITIKFPASYVVFITEGFSHDGTLLRAVVDREWWNFVKHVRDDPYSRKNWRYDESFVLLPVLIGFKSRVWYLYWFSAFVSCRFRMNGIAMSVNAALWFIVTSCLIYGRLLRTVLSNNRVGSQQSLQLSFSMTASGSYL